jgi:hypothetical protein
MMKPVRNLLPVLVLSLAALAPPSLASAKVREAKPAAPAKSIRVAVMPLMNRSQEALADQVVNAVLKEQLREFDAARASFLLAPDVERILGARGEYRRAVAIAERWGRDGTVDSAAVAAIDSVLGVDAVLCVAISDWEVKRITVINAGQSSTTIGLRFALFDVHGGKLLWKKEPREERQAEEFDISSGSVSFDETGTIQSRRTNEPPRAKEVAEDLVKSAFKKFPRS